jgi:tol-pal system protein YbgF
MVYVKAKKYKQGVEAFAGFIARYPDHPYAANATYWEGECYYSLGDFANASARFEGVTVKYSTSAKVPDALLKLGLSERKLGNGAKAHAAFDRLRKEFPLTEAARKIPAEEAP